jgi:hypothetical protein
LGFLIVVIISGTALEPIPDHIDLKYAKQITPYDER